SDWAPGKSPACPAPQPARRSRCRASSPSRSSATARRRPSICRADSWFAGPYRFVRNPMYLGAGIAMAGAALFYQSAALFAYIGAFFVATHLFVVGYEEPTLRRTFGPGYVAYCETVGRWWPGRPHDVEPRV